MIFVWTSKSYAYDYIVIGAKAVAAVSAVTLTAGAIYQYWSTQKDERAYPAPGKMVDVGGYNLHINCTGISEEWQPTVVLEAGKGLSSIDWILVQPGLAKFARVCSVDRAGYGWSDESPLPRTSEYIADELQLLLANSGEQGPFILVGHSFGGATIRIFAHKYHEQVAGLVLVDAVHEDKNEKLLSLWHSSFSLEYFVMSRPRLAAFVGNIGLARLWIRNANPNGLRHDAAPELKAMALAKLSTTKFIRALSEEEAHLDHSLKQLKKVAQAQQPELGDIPLTVITAGLSHIHEGMSEETAAWTKAFEEAWNILQKDLATKSRNSRQVFAEKSGHGIPRDQPEIIVDEIKRFFE